MFASRLMSRRRALPPRLFSVSGCETQSTRVAAVDIHPFDVDLFSTAWKRQQRPEIDACMGTEAAIGFASQAIVRRPFVAPEPECVPSNTAPEKGRESRQGPSWDVGSHQGSENCEEHLAWRVTCSFA